MPRVQRSSTVDLITLELRNAIYDGGLLPGTPLPDLEIARQLGVSRGPFRESAQRLVQEGLLVARPGQGLRVATVGMDQLEELYEARLAIEGAALRRLAREPDPECRARRLEDSRTVLRRVLVACEQAEVLADQAEQEAMARAIGDADLDFHFEMVRAAGNQRLTRCMSTLVIETRMASFGNPLGYVVRTDMHGPHSKRLELVLKGDGEGAVRALREHFSGTVHRLTGHPEAGVRTMAAELSHDELELGPIGG